MIFLLLLVLATATLDLSGLSCNIETERILYSGNEVSTLNFSVSKDSSAIAKQVEDYIFSSKKGGKK